MCCSTLDSTSSQISRLFRGLCRVLLGLCVWSGPTPLLHAHQMTGTVLERNADLAEHVRSCHRRDTCEHCQHWHMHLVLWGEVQHDTSDNGSQPQRPDLKQLEAEFALAPSVAGAVVGSIGFLSDGEHGELAGFCGELFPAMVSLDAANRIPLWTYQTRVAARRDVACLLMVSRC